MRILASALVVVSVLAAPLLVAQQADHLDAFFVLRLLVLAGVNILLATIWGSAAKVPKTDLAALAMICATTVVLVLMFLMDAMTKYHGF